MAPSARRINRCRFCHTTDLTRDNLFCSLNCAREWRQVHRPGFDALDAPLPPLLQDALTAKQRGDAVDADVEAILLLWLWLTVEPDDGAASGGVREPRTRPPGYLTSARVAKRLPDDAGLPEPGDGRGIAASSSDAGAPDERNERARRSA